jgi:hypothetical protein
MNLFKRLERKMFTGEVLQDYGDFQDATFGKGWFRGFGRLRTSLLLCRRKGKLVLTVRSIGTSPFSAQAQYVYVDITPQTLIRLEGVLADAKRALADEARSQPPVIAGTGD